MSEEIKQPKADPSACPRCGARLVLVDGWAEYGDQLVEIQRFGCYTCGYVLYEDEDEENDDAFS